MIYRTKNTVIILEDEYLSIDRSEIAFVKKCIQNMGLVVKTMTVDEFIFADSNFPDYFGDVLIVPTCDKLPLAIKRALKNYSENHGSVLFIGGPLFYDSVEKIDGSYKKIPIHNTLDANFVSENSYVREGLAPSYKVYNAKDISALKTVRDQKIFSGNLSIPAGSEVIIPCETNHGWGYNTDANCRFISLVDCYDKAKADDILELGLRNGNRGSFSYIELENTRGIGYRGRVNYGMVESTQIGSAIAVIGYNGGIHNINGSKELLTALISSLKRGLFLFEAGCNGIVFRQNDSITFGAKVMNTTETFKKVSINFCIDFKNDSKTFSFEKLLSPKAISDVSFLLDYKTICGFGIDFDREYKISVSLEYNSQVIDGIVTEFSFEKEINETNDSLYVKTKGNKFYLNDIPWYMAGMNYWPTYSQSKEKSNYWLGFCDQSNYDPITIENDLLYMEKIGINCVITRIDFTDFDRCVHGVRDFIKRCKKHNIRIGLAFTKATATRFYDFDAVELILSRINIANNPTVAFIDMEWESACDPFRRVANGEYDDEWQNWLIKKYGTIEKAGKILDVVWKFDLFGFPEIPEPNNNKIMAEICEFSEESINKYWERCIGHIRKLFPNQLITFRYGTAYPRGKAHASHFIDFSALEIYDFNGFDQFDDKDCRDNCVGLCVASVAVQSFETNNKPIVWAEYGRSACGIKWHNELFYDHNNHSYLERELKYQTKYNEFVQQVAEESFCAGTAPWWWCGGFRYTELADFGYVSPSGKLNESGKSYVEFCKRMKTKIAETDCREICSVEMNVYDFVDAKNELIEKYGIAAYKEAKKHNKKLVIRTLYTIKN